MRLDVGCGNHPRGDVNVDIITGWNPQTGDQKDDIRFVDPKDIPNFVKASGECLPFRNGIFQEVCAYEVVEHSSNPVRMIKEMLRVSNSAVSLTCPHRFSRSAVMPFHRNVFNVTWFVNLAKRLGCDVDIELTHEDLLPPIAFLRIPILRPSGIKVVLKK